MSHVWICPELVILTNWLIVEKGDSWVKPGRHLWPSGRDKRLSSRDGRDSACNNCCCGPLPVKPLWAGDGEKQPAPQATSPLRTFGSDEVLSIGLDIIGGQQPSQNRSSTTEQWGGSLLLHQVLESLCRQMRGWKQQNGEKVETENSWRTNWSSLSGMRERTGGDSSSHNGSETTSLTFRCNWMVENDRIRMCKSNWATHTHTAL